jgi:hypothetical protein
MAGGIWYSQNKIRPGAYINFEKTEEVDLNSSKGIVAVALDLDFGAEDEIINLSASELASGKSLAKVGLLTSDENAKILNLILTNATLAKIYRLNKGGNKAEGTIGNLAITAKYSGTFGNKIAILITQDNSIYDVNTYANGYLVDTQRVTKISDLSDNDFVTFTGDGDLEETSTSMLLTGGTNGTTAAATAYSSFFELLTDIKWNVLAVCNNAEAINPLIPAFIKKMRDNEGKYVQAVVANYADANYEGIINNVNGVVINGVTYSAVEFTGYVAGITASATATESNTGKVIENATQIIGQLSNDEIESGLKTGKFILSTNQDGSIKVEQDINSLHNYSDDLGYAFTKNRVIRVLDEIGTSIKSIWETTYLGKVSNNEDGRDLFKSSITTYLTNLQDNGAIQNFAGSSDVTVEVGEKIDAVVASIKIMPVDSMEFLYLTVNVSE